MPMSRRDHNAGWTRDRHRPCYSGLQRLSQDAWTSARLTKGSLATACSAKSSPSARNVMRPPVLSSNGPPT